MNFVLVCLIQPNETFLSNNYQLVPGDNVTTTSQFKFSYGYRIQFSSIQFYSKQ